MSQELRNKIYAVAGSVFGLAVLLGLITNDDSVELLRILEGVLGVIGTVGVLINSALAWWNSRISRVTTVSVPKELISSVDIAAPGSEGGFDHITLSADQVTK